MAFRSDRHIQVRRERELKQQDFAHQLKMETNMKFKADWENKTDGLLQNNLVKGSITELHRQHEELLEIRRQKLAELLSREEEQYEQEFFANLETPEQVREKMAKRLQELRAKRGQIHHEDVQQKLDTRFRQSADELRQLDSQFMAASVKIDQEQQMLEKVKRREKEMQEEMLYAKLCEVDVAQKAQREIEEKKVKEQEKTEVMAKLEQQRNLREIQRAQEVQKAEDEKAMLRTQWKEEDLRAKALEEDRARQMRELNYELIQHNALEKGQKQRLLAIEKERDKAMINEVMDSEHKLAELEREMKLRRLAEAKETLQTLDNRAEKQRQEELLIERLAEEERKRQADLEDARYMKEQEARINLLKDVYNERAKAIENKRMDQDKYAALLEEEKQYLQAKLLREEAEQEERRALERLRKKHNQEDLLEQMKAKERELRREEQEKMYERRAALLAELEYRRKIDVEKEKALKEVETLKNTKGMSAFAQFSQ